MLERSIAKKVTPPSRRNRSRHDAFNHISHLDQNTKVITSVTWGQIQDYVNPYGLAVEVQQSSNIFTVGGSLGVNAHGRDPRFGPVIETVKSLRVMNGAGEILNVSRLENSELFSLVIGGYGLFGVVLSADIQLTEDDVYKKSCKTLDYRAYPAYFEANVANQPDVGLHYARPSIRHSDLLGTTVACTFAKTTERPAVIFRLQQKQVSRGTARSSTCFASRRWAKTSCVFLQNTFSDKDSVHIISRNNAMRPEVAFLEYNSPYDTGILQE